MSRWSRRWLLSRSNYSFIHPFIHCSFIYLSIQGEVSIDSSEPVLEELEPQLAAEPVQLESDVATPGRIYISAVDPDPIVVKKTDLKKLGN